MKEDLIHTKECGCEVKLENHKVTLLSCGTHKWDVVNEN